MQNEERIIATRNTVNTILHCTIPLIFKRIYRHTRKSEYVYLLLHNMITSMQCNNQFCTVLDLSVVQIQFDHWKDTLWFIETLNNEHGYVHSEHVDRQA